MESANFIPLGDVNSREVFDGPASSAAGGGEKRMGKTKEERKQIAREIRLKAKKEKKKIKADAKKQRKQNAIMHRRMTRNSEKYNKNKDRNKQRAIDLERTKIRYDAVRQAERMAAKYDMSGKLFNVGEVVVLEDGRVKSKEALRKAGEEKARKEAAARGEDVGTNGDSAASEPGLVNGLNPERAALMSQPSAAVNGKPKKISNKQQKKLEMYAPKPVPPKPVLPEGYTLPEEEENLIALWDITDEQILKRLADAKRNKKSAAKQLRRAQKEKKKLNKAMKQLKKQAANKGVLWDAEAARKEILGDASYLANNGDDSDSDSSSSGDDEDSEADVEWESDDEIAKKKKKAEKKRRKSSMSDEGEQSEIKKLNISRPKINMTLLQKAEEKEAELQQRKRLAKERRKAERRAAAQKAEEEAKQAAAQVKNAQQDDSVPEKSSKKRKRSKDDEVEPSEKTAAHIKKESKKSKKQKTVESNGDSGKIAQESAAPIQNGDSEVVEAGKKEKKRKRSKAQDDDQQPIQEADEQVTIEKKHKKEKKEKKDKKHAKEAEESTTNGHNGAEQWNPEALTGGDARQDKFLRLLGAKKSVVGNGADEKARKKSSGRIDDISRREGELEKQFEMGIKMKHEAGGKRKGLGA